MRRYLILGMLALKVYRTFFADKEGKKRQQQEEHHASTTGRPGLGMFVGGLAIGAVATYLTTPTTGAAARSKLRGRLETVRDGATRNANRMRETLDRRKEDLGRVRKALMDKLAA